MAIDAAELAEFFKTDEGKVVVESLTKPLADKNTQLLSELKKAKGADNSHANAELDELREKAKKLAELETKALEEKGEFKTLLETSRAQNKEIIDGLTAERDGLKKQFTDSLVTGGLTSELARVGVNPLVMDMIVPGLSSAVTVVEGKAMVGDQNLTEFVDAWAKTDVASYMIKSGNSGGGAGGGGKGAVETEEKFFDPKSPDYNMTEQVRVLRADKETYDKLTEKHGGRTPFTGKNSAA